MIKNIHIIIICLLIYHHSVYKLYIGATYQHSVDKEVMFNGQAFTSCDQP